MHAQHVSLQGYLRFYTDESVLRDSGLQLQPTSSARSVFRGVPDCQRRCPQRRWNLRRLPTPLFFFPQFSHDKRRQCVLRAVHFSASIPPQPRGGPSVSWSTAAMNCTFNGSRGTLGFLETFAPTPWQTWHFEAPATSIQKRTRGSSRCQGCPYQKRIIEVVAYGVCWPERPQVLGFRGRREYQTRFPEMLSVRC